MNFSAEKFLSLATFLKIIIWTSSFLFLKNLQPVTSKNNEYSIPDYPASPAAIPQESLASVCDAEAKLSTPSRLSSLPQPASHPRHPRIRLRLCVTLTRNCPLHLGSSSPSRRQPLLAATPEYACVCVWRWAVASPPATPEIACVCVWRLLSPHPALPAPSRRPRHSQTPMPMDNLMQEHEEFKESFLKFRQRCFLFRKSAFFIGAPWVPTLSGREFFFMKSWLRPKHKIWFNLEKRLFRCGIERITKGTDLPPGFLGLIYMSFI